jgi:hypothetical protein
LESSSEILGTTAPWQRIQWREGGVKEGVVRMTIPLDYR